MNYYYINTDTDALTDSPHDEWISQGCAFTSGVGAAGYKKYGVEVLGKLDPDDILFMYVNECGVVAAGTVRECWDGCGYESETRKIYRDPSITEYRIRVDWTEAHPPIDREQLIEIVGWTPRPTLQRITDIDAGRSLHAEVMRRNRAAASESR